MLHTFLSMDNSTEYLSKKIVKRYSQTILKGLFLVISLSLSIGVLTANSHLSIFFLRAKSTHSTQISKSNPSSKTVPIHTHLVISETESEEVSEHEHHSTSDDFILDTCLVCLQSSEKRTYFTQTTETVLITDTPLYILFHSLKIYS